LDPKEIVAIIPLGNLNPRSGHVFPTDHVYFDYGGKTGLVVFAPGPGKIFAISDQLSGGAKLEVAVNENLSYYLAHVLPRADIKVGAQLAAGQALGWVSATSLLDLGACDSRVKLPGFINPARYPSPTLQTVSPLALFVEPLRGRLYAMVNREGPDKDGKIDFDRPGRLVGNWFHESLAVAESGHGRPGTWARQLAFVPDVRQPSAVRVSIGGTVAPVGLFGVGSGAPDPATVTVNSGLMKYELLPFDAREPSRKGPTGQQAENSGVLLVQLVNATRLKVEYVSGQPASAVERFTSKAALYVR
jgi:hypothetical protein